MHRVRLGYTLAGERDAADLQHPLVAMLAAVHDTGSISAAARTLGLSYRHVWGELHRWETELGHGLVLWVKGQPARLTPFGEKLLWAERRARARLAPQIEALRTELERAFAVAFDDDAGVVTMSASHDDALPALRERAGAALKLHLDIDYTGSVDALTALNQGRSLMAGFHALIDAPPGSPTARVYKPMLKPGVHKLVGFARRTQGLIVAPGNPLGLHALENLQRDSVRLVMRTHGAGSRVVLEELLAQRGLPLAPLEQRARSEPSHRGLAEAVASGAADVAFGLESFARARGLDFVPLAEERYFLAVLQPSLEHPQVRALLALLQSPAWQAQLAQIPGHAPERSGEVLSLKGVLPWWSYRTPKA